MGPGLRSALLFLVFNRPDTTACVFNEIRKARPERLYVAADGPRASRPGEGERCGATRRIATAVDWPCQVKTLFREQNLGCKRAVSSAIDWFFAHEEEGIILEDDCVPDPTFFRYCDELLEYYRNDSQVALVSGDNFQFGTTRAEASYYFSRYVHIWGWASWRRVWRLYDRDCRNWPEFDRSGRLNEVLKGRPREARYWRGRFQAVHAGRIDTWDYQLNLMMWSHRMMSILPQVNLISNIGFGADATHTRGESRFGNMAVEPMSFPLKHPDTRATNDAADDLTARQMFLQPLSSRAVAKIRTIVRRAVGA
jgi:hypothetical protein